MPHYDPNNVIKTGAKYDPNTANSGMGAASSGGSSPSFTNGMGMKAQQQLSPGAANWTGSASGPGSSSSTGSQGSGSSGILRQNGDASCLSFHNIFGFSYVRLVIIECKLCM